MSSANIIVWSGAGTAKGDALNNVANGTIGFNNDAAQTGNVYIKSSVGWIDTGQIVAGYFNKQVSSTGVAQQPWVTWSGAGVGNAPSALGYNTIGFDADGAPTSTLYIYTASTDTWTATAQTFNGFIGL